MNLDIILTSSITSELMMKRKDKFIAKFMATRSLLDYFAIQ